MEAARAGSGPQRIGAPGAGGELDRRAFVRAGGALGATLWAAPQLSTIRLAQVAEIGSPPPDTTPGSTVTSPTSTTTTTGPGTTTTTGPGTTTTTGPATTTTTGTGTTVETLGSTTTSPATPTTAPTGTTAPGKVVVTTPPNTSPPIATPPVTAAGGPTTTAAGAPTGGGPGGSGGPGGPGGGSAGDDAGGGPRGFLPFTGSDVRGVALLGAAAVAIGRAMTKARNRVPWLALDDDAPSNGEPTQHD